MDFVGLTLAGRPRGPGARFRGVEGSAGAGQSSSLDCRPCWGVFPAAIEIRRVDDHPRTVSRRTASRLTIASDRDSPRAPARAWQRRWPRAGLPPPPIAFFRAGTRLFGERLLHPLLDEAALGPVDGPGPHWDLPAKLFPFLVRMPDSIACIRDRSSFEKLSVRRPHPLSTSASAPVHRQAGEVPGLHPLLRPGERGAPRRRRTGSATSASPRPASTAWSSNSSSVDSSADYHDSHAASKSASTRASSPACSLNRSILPWKRYSDSEGPRDLG